MAMTKVIVAPPSVARASPGRVRSGPAGSPEAAARSPVAAARLRDVAEPRSLAPNSPLSLYPMPDSGPMPIVKAIDAAQSAIDLSIYEMTDDTVISALKGAAARGVKVRVMIEPNPISNDGEPSTFPALKADLEAAGISVTVTPPQFDSTTFPSPDADNHNVDHAKFMVIDGKDLLFGTGNLARGGLGDGVRRPNRDFWVEDVRPESIDEAEALFNADWTQTSTSGIQFTNLVVSPDNARQKILEMIDGAKHRLYVYNQMFRDPELIDHLIAAKNRGVNVVVLAAGPYSSSEDDSNAAAIKKLTDAGVKAQEYTALYLHAKAMVADDRAFIGSQNFTRDGMDLNREFGEITDDPGVVNRLVKKFISDNASPTVLPFTPTEKAMFDLINGAQNRLYVNVPRLFRPELIDAIIAAAKRGVDVKALLQSPIISHDRTWALQVHLQDNGVEVDVRDSDPIPGKLALADGTILEGTGASATNPSATPSTDTDPKDASALADQFQALFAPKQTPDPSATLLPRETVRLLPMPESTNVRIVEALNAAKKSIDLEIYQLQDRSVVAALKAAAKRGVAVRVMLEPQTIGGNDFPEMVTELKRAKVNVIPTPPSFDEGSKVDHAKLIVIDGQEVLFGTGNLVRTGLGGNTDPSYNNRDFWVEDSRAASVDEASKLFEADWTRQSTSGITFKNLIVTPDNANERILALIDSAKQRLYVYNQEFVDPTVIDHLLQAKARGVDVQVLLGFQPAFGGQPPENEAARQRLVAAGIPAQFFTAHYLHAKAIVSDDQAYLGSQNFSNGGLRNNREVGEQLDDPTLVTQLVQTFHNDMANPFRPDDPPFLPVS